MAGRLSDRRGVNDPLLHDLLVVFQTQDVVVARHPPPIRLQENFTDFSQILNKGAAGIEHRRILPAKANS